MGIIKADCIDVLLMIRMLAKKMHRRKLEVMAA